MGVIILLVLRQESLLVKNISVCYIRVQCKVVVLIVVIMCG